MINERKKYIVSYILNIWIYVTIIRIKYIFFTIRRYLQD